MHVVDHTPSQIKQTYTPMHVTSTTHSQAHRLDTMLNNKLSQSHSQSQNLKPINATHHHHHNT